MIIFFSEGRLGNQLFQYAFLKTIAKDNERILVGNMSELFELFEGSAKSFIHIRYRNEFRFLVSRILKPYFLKYLVKLGIIGYIEQNRSETAALPDYSYKKGFFPLTYVASDFFQSEKFFDFSKFDLKLKSEFVKEARKILDEIPSDYDLVFVHLRRGDYLFEKYLNKRGIDLPPDYYFTAIKKLEQEVQNPFYIFLSDDPCFVEVCFKDIKNKFVSRNSMGVDLALMMLCKYGIVSNSSFSWWGACLMKKKKKVIFPKYWYGWKQKVESHAGIQPDKQWAETVEP
jgi:hypothetical protein